MRQLPTCRHNTLEMVVLCRPERDEHLTSHVVVSNINMGVPSGSTHSQAPAAARATRGGRWCVAARSRRAGGDANSRLKGVTRWMLCCRSWMVNVPMQVNEDGRWCC
ncbi:hypothetical protein M433DRAFT_453134 [Acidomyces richmondensis BFW]|nr:hypothetical protein M433DRAFT_453134 [Acidomyces richmondensis BFW]